MSLNKTNIEWTDYSWNPITGCLNACPYCYARKLSMRFVGHFIPTFHSDRLSDPYRIKTPSKIFTCSMADFFGPWLPDVWVMDVLFTIGNNPRHIFQVLTKCPENIEKWTSFFPPNLWLGVSVARQDDIKRIFYLKVKELKFRFVSFEPLLGPVKANLEGLDWIIIGAQTNPSRIPKKEWVQPLLDQARRSGIPIFLKNNLKWEEKIQEFPLRTYRSV